MTESSPTGGAGRLNVEKFARATNQALSFTDWTLDAIEDRVSALEEITAARWPRRITLRRRLARSLRASVAGREDFAPGFAVRRAERFGEDLIHASQRRRRGTS